MGLRICLVTPFSWSQPHEVNDHVAGAAGALRDLGHEVCVLAPSNRASELASGRRALRRLGHDGTPLDGLVALGPAISVSPRRSVGVPVGVRANLRLALARGGFDVVHGHEPGIPSISYLGLRDAGAIAVATFHASDRLGYPPGKSQRARLLARIDALTATSEAVARAAAARFPGEYTILPAGIDNALFRPGKSRQRFVLEWDTEQRAQARAAIRALRLLDGWDLVLLRTRTIMGRPYVPRGLRARVHLATALDAPARAEALRGAVGFIPAVGGSPRLLLEAQMCGVPPVAPPQRHRQPELIAAAMARLAEDSAFQEAEQSTALRSAEGHSNAVLGAELDALYRRLLRRRRSRGSDDPLGDRAWILADLHLHTAHSHDCSVPVADLLQYAGGIGLGAIAVTDHNVFTGALEAVELAHGHGLRVIPGEEVKTSDQGEVIGLFLQEQIPGGMPLADTLAAIRAQGGLVYLPHPFDRLHSIPDAAALHRHLAEIDVFEAYNARLLFDTFNEEAARFARKYNLLTGAGSDAHVLQGVGTGAVRMREFRTAEEFLISLRSAEIVQRPKPLLYLQSLKWMAQARERRVRAAVR